MTGVQTCALPIWFTRKKHDPGFPSRAVEHCLAQAGIGIKDLKYVVFYDKPLIKFERLLETYLGFAPKGIQSFLAAMPVWLKEKLFLRTLLRKEVLACSNGLEKSALPEFLFGEHHESHAASAFFASPYEKAGVLCMDEREALSAYVTEKGSAGLFERPR